MSHYHRIPELLDNLVMSPSVAGAARRTGLTAATVWNYLIRSRRNGPGDEPLQNIQWMGVTCSFEQHFANAKILAAAAIEQSALDRAQNGCWVPSYYQGAPVWEENDDFVGWSDAEMEALGFDPKRDRFVWENGRRKQVRVWLKPSEQLAIKMLESWHKRYRPHQQVDVNYGGVLRLERPDERTATKTIEAKPLFDDDTETEQRGGHLALGRPAASSEEMDTWHKAGEFAPTPVAFVDATGNRTERVAAPDPLLPQPADSALVKDLKVHAATPPINGRAGAMSQRENVQGVDRGNTALLNGARGFKVC